MSSLKTGIRQLFAASWGQLAAAFVLLGSVRVYTEFMAPDRFGEAMLILGGLGLIDGFCTMAFIQTCTQLLKDLDSHDERRALGLGMALEAAWPFGAIAVLGLLASLPFVAWGLMPELLAAAVLYVIFEPVRSLGRAMIQLNRQLGLTSAWLTAEALVTLACSYALIRASGGTGVDLLLGAVAGRAFTSIVFLPILLGSPRHWTADRLGATRRKGEAYAFARPIAAMAPVGWLAFSLDRYLVGVMLGLEAAGLFAALGGVVSRPFSILSAGLTNVFRPDLLDQAAGRSLAQPRPLRRWMATAAAIALAGTLAFVVMGDLLARLMIADEHGLIAAGGTLMAVLALSQSVLVVTHAMENRLMIAGLARRLLLWEALALVVGAPLIAAGAYLGGTVGAAWGRVGNEVLRMLVAGTILVAFVRLRSRQIGART